MSGARQNDGLSPARHPRRVAIRRGNLNMKRTVRVHFSNGLKRLRAPEIRKCEPLFFSKSDKFILQEGKRSRKDGF